MSAAIRDTGELLLSRDGAVGQACALGALWHAATTGEQVAL
ncbi:MAG TPA: hypothetical protein VGJ77_15760 [Gaiellaceae bacterium]